MRKWLLALAVLLGASPAVAVQDSSSGSGQLAIRAGDVARIDIVVTDASGHTSENLKAEDFQVLEDGAPRPIDAVRFVKAGGQPQPSSGTVVPISSRADEQAAASRDD